MGTDRCAPRAGELGGRERNEVRRVPGDLALARRTQRIRDECLDERWQAVARRTVDSEVDPAGEGIAAIGDLLGSVGIVGALGVPGEGNRPHSVHRSVDHTVPNAIRIVRDCALDGKQGAHSRPVLLHAQVGAEPLSMHHTVLDVVDDAGRVAARAERVTAA